MESVDTWAQYGASNDKKASQNKRNNELWVRSTQLRSLLLVLSQKCDNFSYMLSNIIVQAVCVFGWRMVYYAIDYSRTKEKNIWKRYEWSTNKLFVRRICTNYVLRRKKKNAETKNQKWQTFISYMKTKLIKARRRYGPDGDGERERG